MDNMTKPLTASVGDVIAHDLMPQSVWTGQVLGVEDCETGPEREEPHSAFRVIDSEGNEDTVCAYDVHRAE